MGDLLAETVPLALAGAISPLMLLGALVLLASPHHPVIRCGAFALGVLTMAAGMFAAGYLLLGLDTGGRAGVHGALSSPAAQIAMAVFLLATAAWFVFKAPSEAAQQRWLDRIASPRIPALAYYGVGLVIVWFSASFVVIAAILHRISVAGQPLDDNLVVLGVAVVITSLPALVPFLLALVGGVGVRSRLEVLGRWTFRNGRFILAALFVVLTLQNLLKAL